LPRFNPSPHGPAPARGVACATPVRGTLSQPDQSLTRGCPVLRTIDLIHRFPRNLNRAAMRAAPAWVCALWRLVVVRVILVVNSMISIYCTVAKAPTEGQAGAARRIRRAGMGAEFVPKGRGLNACRKVRTNGVGCATSAKASARRRGRETHAALECAYRFSQRSRCPAPNLLTASPPDARRCGQTQRRRVRSGKEARALPRPNRSVGFSPRKACRSG